MLLQEFVDNSALAITGINDEPQSKLEEQQQKLAAALTSDRKREIGRLMAEKKRNKQTKFDATKAATTRNNRNSTAENELDHRIPIPIRIRTNQTANNGGISNASQLVDNQLHQDSHYLTLPPSVLMTAEQSWYQPYPTTLGLILLLHLIFGLQWNRQRTKQHSLASYKILVQHKQFHRAIVAILSHPPTTNNNNNNTNNGAVSRTAVDIGTDTTTTATHPPGTLVAPDPGLLMQRLQILLRPVLSGHLSGLPLLCYNSHILWACRSLEVQSTADHYVHELIGLAVVAMALELQWKNVLLKLLARNDASPAFFHQARRRLPLVPLGSLTGLSAALLMRYRHSLPHVVVQVFPIVSISNISSSSNSIVAMDPTATHGLALALLTWCSYKTHPGVVFGAMSGLLWNWGLTSWLGHVYWGTILVWWIGMASCLSLKAAAGAEQTIPMVDYVSWDSRGRMLESHDDALEAQDDMNDSDDDMDDEDNSIVVDPENPTRTSSTIRGRLPPLMVLDEGGPPSLSASSWMGGGDSQAVAAARRRGNFLST
jgi:hypothetical protein